MSEPERSLSPRAAELLDLAYEYAIEHGLADLSLRPLAAAIDSSPRVLLFLFGSKEGLIRALLARARSEELELLARLRARHPRDDLAAAALETWGWLSAAEHRGLLRLWVEGYARSLVEPDGPWAEFARSTVQDWLALLAAYQPAVRRRTAAGTAERTAVLAILRGALLDLLATDDEPRVTAAVTRAIAGRNEQA